MRSQDGVCGTRNATAICTMQGFPLGGGRRVQVGVLTLLESGVVISSSRQVSALGTISEKILLTLCPQNLCINPRPDQALGQVPAVWALGPQSCRLDGGLGARSRGPSSSLAMWQLGPQFLFHLEAGLEPHLPSEDTKGWGRAWGALLPWGIFPGPHTDPAA